ncbi:MAG: hypothetical protein KDA96_21195, partial [Planctomycetaceae bacterium]|nr:hypothetical protein [Planctomycetaceae bacterium]
MSTIAATNHPKPAVYSVGLDPDSNREITLAAEANAMGFRIEGGFEGLQPEEHHSARGCLFVGPDATEDLPESLLAASRLSVIAVLPSCPADRASQLMRQGLYAVVTLPLQQPALVELIVDAARQSELRHARLSENVGAIQRMGQATAKELEVLDLIIAGQKNREIAETLGI